MSNIIDKMYDDLKAKGYLSKDRDTFNKFFFAPGETGYQNRKKLYDDLHSKGYLQSSSYEDFAKRIGLHSVRPSQTASRQQNVAQQANKNAAAQAAAAKSAPTQPEKGGWRPNAEQMAGYQRFTDGVLRTVKNGDDVMNRVNTRVARAKRPNQQKVNLGFNNKHSLLGGGSQVQHEGKKFDAAKGDFVDQYSTEAGNVYDNTYEADAEQYNINRNKRDADTLDMVADIERQIREQEELLEKTRKASRDVEAPNNLWDAIRYTMSHADGPRLDQEDIDEEAIKANITNLQNKRSLLLHGTSIGQKVGKSIGDQLAEVNRMIGDDIDNYYKRHPNGGPTLVSHDYHATGQYQINPYLDVAARSLEDAQEMFNEAGKSVGESGLTGFGKGVIRGFGSKLFDARTWDMGYTDLKGGLSLAEVLRKADEGKPLTAEQQKMLDAKATELACAAYFSGALGRGYKAGQVTAESIPFMLEFMLNPLSGTGRSAQAMLTRYALKRFGRKATMELGEDAAKKILYGDIRQLTKSVFDKGLSKGARGLAAKTLASKAGARIAGDITGAAGMTATTGQGRVVADMLNRATGQVKFGVDTDGRVKYTGHDAPEESSLLTAYGKAFGSQFSENYSEFMGPYISYVGGMFANGLKKIGGKYLFDGLSSLRNRSAAAVMKLPFAPMVSDFIREATKSDWAKVIKGMQKRAHWDGTAEEYLEEVAGNMLNAILVGDNDFSTEEGRGVFNLSDNIDTFLGVGLMSGAMSVSSAAGYRTPAYRARKMVENADARGEKLLGGSLWGKFKSSFDAAQSEQDKQVILTALLQNSSLTNEGRRAVLQYARGKQFQQAVADGTFREMEEDAEKGNEVERACRAEYTEGQNIDSVEEMRDAKTRYNVLLREALAVEPNAEMYSDPQFYEQSNPNATPERKAAMRAYAEAKAQYEGVADRMKTDMADQQQKANEQVERFKNQTDGLITRVRLRGSDAEFYVTSGHISLNNDGTINDAATSSNLTIVDGEGNQRFISRGDVVDVLAQNTPEETLEQLNDIIMNEAKAKADLIDGKLSFRAGDTFTILNNEGQEQKVTIDFSLAKDSSTIAPFAFIEGEQAAVPLTEDSMAKLQQMSDAYQESRFGKYRQEQQDAVANAENEATQEEATPTSPTVAQEEAGAPTEGRSYGYGESVSYVDGEGHTQEGVVHGKTPEGTYEVEFDNPPSGKEVVDEYTQEELDALVQPSSAEQTEEVVPEQVPEEEPAEPQGNDAADSVPPTTEELVEMARGGNELAQYQLDQQGIQWKEPAEQTKDNVAAQSPKNDVPRDKDGNIIYDQVPVATTIEDLYDGALDDEEIGNFVQSQIDAAKKAVDKITKKKPQISTNKSAYLEAKKKWEGELREAERKAQYWNDVKAEVEKITTPADERTDDNSGSEGGKDSEGEVRTRDEGSDEQESSSEESAVVGLREQETDSDPTLVNVIRTLYQKGKDYASKIFNMKFFDFATTPDFMKHLGMTGSKFTIRYGVIARHFGKDGSHDFTQSEWEQIPHAIEHPFAVTQLKNKEKGFRIYTALKTEKGEYVVVGVDVKNAGRDMEVNAIATMFGRRSNANLPENEEVIYKSKEITPEQEALLSRPNSDQYPAERESSDGKVKDISDSVQENGDKSSENEGEAPLSAKIEAASADVNTDPTEAQKEAGNYKKGHVHVGSFDITIEQPKGSVRKGTDANGKQWESKMHNTYGYFRGTEGVDGDHIDVFLSNDIDGWNRQTVFVVDQYNPDGSFDEHKVMLGFNNAEEAKRDYLANYEKGWENGRRIDVSAVNLADFEKWIASSHRKTKPFSEYSSVKKEGSASSETKQSKSTAEEKPFNAVIEMLRKKFPDASMEALTAADRLLREQALPGERQKAIEAVAKALGLKVEWRDTMEKENGTFNPKTRTITIARDSEHALANTFGHEVTHAVRNLSEADYKNLKDAVRRLYSSEKEYNEAVQAYGDMYTGLDFDALEEELIADNIGFMIGGKNDMTQELASRMNHRVLWAIHDAMNKVRNALAKVLHIDSKKSGLLEAIDSARATIRETMANAQRIAKEKGQGLSNESGSARQSLRTQDSASEFAEKHGVAADDVRQYAEGMKSGNLQKADWALSEIRRTMRVANRGMKLSEFGKLFRPIQNELAERYGDIERLRQEHIDAEMRERNLMEAARKKAEEEERNRQARLEELSLLGDAEVDKRYMDALKRGDEATAREMLDEAARRKGYGDAESDYQGEGAWAAPSNPGYKSADERRADLENNTIFNVEDMALGYSAQPSDYFEHPKRYLQDTPHGLESTQSIQKAIEAVKRGDKDVKVKVYRAVPTSVKEGKLRNGDWVTPSKKYAEMHGNSRLEGKYRIIEDEVPVDELWWDGNDANEWGYDNGKGYKYKNVKNNRKSDDLVTRDDKGNVIPPSKRFNQRKADERYQKRTDGVKPSKAEVALRDALVEHMRLSFKDMIADEEGQRVLDMANGRDTRFEAAHHKSEAARRRDEMLRAIDQAKAFISGKTEQQTRAERRERERKFREETKVLYDRVLAGNFDSVTLQLLDDFINKVTPNNYYGRPLSKRLSERTLRKVHERERTSSVDALFSRISESAVPADERTRPEAKRRIEEKKKELLKGWAIATGNWHTAVSDFTDDTKPIGSGKDSVVYHSKDGKSVIKVSKGKESARKFRPDMDNVALFNTVFPASKYEIIGYGEIDGKFVRFLRQPIVDFTDSTPLSVEERVAYMERLGFRPMNDEKTAFTNGEIVASDIQGNNIVKDRDGNIRVIDADMRFHTKEFGGKYSYPAVETDTETAPNIREQRVYHGNGANGVRFFRTANGKAYGFTVGGKIYIDPRIATSETPVHEYAHLWATALKSANAKEWQNVVGLMKGTKVWDEVKALYPELKSDDEIADEVLATYSGRRGAERLREEQRRIAKGNGSVFEKAEAISALESVKQALKRFWKGVADFLHIHYTSAEEVADRVMKDLLDGVDPRKFGDGGKSLDAYNKIRKHFIGEQGAERADHAEEVTTRIDNLNVAREMEDAKKDAKAIKMATGWERGADGKWRYEIPDLKYFSNGYAGWKKARARQPWIQELDALSDKLFEGEDLSDSEMARFDELAAKESAFKAEFLNREKPHLADWVENDELFKAYPDLKRVNVVFTDQLPTNVGGSYNEREHTIVVNTNYVGDIDSVLAHEVQHAIQKIEGFARGGNPESIQERFKAAKKEWRARAWADELRYKADEMGEHYNQAAVEKALIDEYKEMGMDNEEWMPDKETRMKGFNYFARGYADRSMDADIKNFRLAESTRADFSPYMEYTKLGGEVESRNVEKRMKMSPEERRASLAAETEDVSREDQIFLFGEGGTSMKTSSDLNEMFGSRWLDEQTNDDGRHTTQVKSTINSYKKFVDWVKRDSNGRDVDVLDASSGLGLGTAWMRDNGFKVDDVEPFPSDSREAPTFSSYDEIDKKYDYIISNAVLNVIPDDWRANVLHQMADKLKDGGKLVINVRGAESISKQGKEGETRITLDSPSEILVLRPNGSIKAYQKGFTKSELKEWCEKELGEGYSVEIANNKNAGGSYDTAVVVTKNNESGTVGVASEAGHPSWSAQAMPNSVAKLNRNPKLTKDLDGLLNNISKKGMGAHEFLFNVAKTFGLKGDNFNKSFYTDLGDSVGIRISDHYANTNNVKQKNKNNEVYGFVVKLSPHRFKSREDANYLEYVYYPDKLTQERQQEIVGGLKKFLETGDYAQLPSPDHVNRSGVFDRRNDIDLESSDVKQSRRGTPNLYPDHIAQAIYEQSVNGFKFDLDEAWHDSLLSVKRLQEAISETRGVPIRDFENVYWHAVTLSSVNAAEMEQLMNLRIQPFIEAVQDICKKHDLTQEGIEVYLNCKHGLERNEAMARRDAEKQANEEFKDELRKAERAAAKDPLDQDAADALDDVKQRMNDREEELYFENRERDYSGLTDIFDPKDKVTGDRLDLTVAELEDEAKKYVKRFEAEVGVADVTKLWDNIHELNNYSLRKSYLSGLISKSQYDSVKQMYQWYVPLRGFNEEVAGDVYTYVTRGETRTQQLLKEAKGRTSRAGDILATMMNMANSAVNQGNRNLMKQKILNLALNAKSPLLSVSSTWYQTDANGFDVPIEPPINDQMTPSEQKDAIEQWEDTMEMLAKQGKVHRMSDNLRLNLRTQKWQADEHCIRVQRGGKEYCVWVNGNPRAAQALNDRLGNQVTKPYKATETILDKAEDLFTDGFIKIFRYMAQSVTSLNPEFVISNFQRDLASASLVSTGKYGVGYTKDFLVNVKRLGVLTGTMSHKKEYRNAAGIYTLYNKYKSGTLDNNNEMERYFAEFMQNGGETGYTQSLSIKDYQSRIQSALGDKGFVKWSKNAGHAVADFVEMANRGVENTCRFAAYMTSRQHGKSVLQAIVDAKEASTNFNLHGAGGFGNAWLRKSIIFINPAVQSIVQYCQLTAKHPKAMLSMLGGTILLGAAMAFACASLVAPGGGDPDSNYWDLSDYVRHNYIVIPSGNGNWTRIALPPEIRAVYGLGVIAMEAALGRMNHSSIPAAIGDQLMQFSPVAFLDPRNFFNRSDSDHSVGKTLIKAFTPTLASPIADAYIWDEDFMGRQITGKNDFNDDKPEFQRVSYDTLPQLVSFSRWLNNISGGNDYKKGWININPSAAGYVASQYIGGPLQFFTKIGKTVAMITYEDLRDMRNVPFLSRFMTSTDNDYGRNQVSNAEFKYWSAIADDVRTQIRGFEKEIESGDTKNLDDYKKLVSSKEYEMYQMIDYMDWLKDIRELNQKRKEETTQDAQKQVTLEIYEVRRKMAECLNKAEEMGVYLDMSQLNLELANAKTTEERAAIQAKINEKRKENLKKIGAIE